MTLRGSLIRLPVAFLLISVLLQPIVGVETYDEQLSLRKQNSAFAASKGGHDDGSQNANAKRPEKGTKDAPVDGLDGKPHAGPFVNPLWTPPEAYTDHTKDARTVDGAVGVEKNPIPEDGVMNDPHRTPPKRGTTGTEGGVSEKERDRIAQESETGQRLPKKPDPPKDSSFSGGVGGRKLNGEYGNQKDVDAQVNGYGSFNNHLESDSDKKHDDGHDEHDDDDDDDDDDDEEGVNDFIPWDSLAGSFSTIAATEIGDKTFIVAALMAMRHSRLQVFSAAYSALVIMTILSGVTGHALGAFISKRWSALLAAVLFLVFGFKALKEGLEMSPNQGVNDEIREVEAELEEKEGDMARNANGHGRDSTISPYALEAGRANGRKSRSRSRLSPPRRSPSSSYSRSRSRARPQFDRAVSGVRNLLGLLLSPAWVETFSMTFVGELGDRSQIATVAMAAGQEYFWVMVGASLGHFVCTAAAVLGGSVLAGRVSLRKVTLIGGAIFIAFGIFTLIEAARYFF